MRNVSRRALALLLALVMMFSFAVPVFASNTNNTANENNTEPVLQLLADGLWIKFHVNYEKSRVFKSDGFVQAPETETDKVTEIPVDEEGNVMHNVANYHRKDIFLAIYDRDSAQPRYFKIFYGRDGIDSVELQADGTPAVPAKKLGTDVNIQAIFLSQEEWEDQPAKVCVRFEYSDPNVVNDKYVLDTNIKAAWIVVDKGVDPKTLTPEQWKDAVIERGYVPTDGVFCFEEKLEKNKDYYVVWEREDNEHGAATEKPIGNGDLFKDENGRNYVHMFSTLGNVNYLYTPDGEVVAIERDAKGVQTNSIEFKIELTPIELGQYLIRALGTGNQPVRDVEFEIFKLKQTDAYHYQQNQFGEYVIEEPAIYRTEGTNWNGYTGIARDDIVVHPATGVVSIRSNTPDGKLVELRAGEILGVRAVENTFQDSINPAAKGYKFNGKVYGLNLWVVKDVKRLNEALKDTSIDPKEVYALREDKVVVVVPFADEFVKIRVKIFNAGATPQVRTPVTGATVALYEAAQTQIGEQLKAGPEIIQKKTDQYGIVTFNDVPMNTAKQFFTGLFGYYGSEGVDGGYQVINMPYLLKQLDTGNHEGLTPYPGYIAMSGYYEADNGSNYYDESLSIQRSDYGKTYDVEIENHGDAFYTTGGRLYGATKYDTAVEIAKVQFPDGLKVKDKFKNVVVAEVDTFADALTAGVVAFEYNAPLLMVEKDEVPAVVEKYIKDEKATRVIIVGGPNTISNATAQKLDDLNGVSVKRISGDNRFGTAVEVGEALRGLVRADKSRPAFDLGYDTNQTVFLANAHTFADALTATVPAAHYGIPILLTHQDKLAPETIQALKDWDIERVIIVGGEKSVAKSIETELGSLGKGYTVERYAGENRQYTSMVLGKEFFADSTKAFFANGTAFADALAGAPYAARVGAPILLVEKDTVSDAVKQYIKDRNITEGTIFGGPNMVSSAVRDILANIINLRSDIKGIW